MPLGAPGGDYEGRNAPSDLGPLLLGYFSWVLRHLWPSASQVLGLHMPWCLPCCDPDEFPRTTYLQAPEA